MNKEWEMVREFQKSFSQPIAKQPTKLSSERVKIRYLWMEEELNEFKDANDITEQTDAIIDLMYFALGALVEMGVKPDDIFEIVHKANMKKINKSGGYTKDKTGKVQKPNGWKSPNPRIANKLKSK